MLTIYAIPISLYCAKLRILLRHKDLRWREIPPPGGYGSDEYKIVVPSGNLPALVDGDLLLADSEAIAEYLNEKNPEPAMLPTDLAQRAIVRQLSRFHDTRLEPALRVLFQFLPPENPDGPIVLSQSEMLTQRMAQLARMLDAKANSERLWLSDCGYAITFAWIDILTPILGLTVQWPDKILFYREAISRHPAVAVELGEYVPKLSKWLADQSAG